MPSESELRTIIEACRAESELDRQVEFLQKLNKSLPSGIQIMIPSLLTDDFVARALERIEERITVTGKK